MKERALLNKRHWNDISEALLPSRVLDFCSTLILESPNEKNCTKKLFVIMDDPLGGTGVLQETSPSV